MSAHFKIPHNTLSNGLREKQMDTHEMLCVQARLCAPDNVTGQTNRNCVQYTALQNIHSILYDIYTCHLIMLLADQSPRTITSYFVRSYCAS